MHLATGRPRELKFTYVQIFLEDFVRVYAHSSSMRFRAIASDVKVCTGRGAYLLLCLSM